MATVSELKKQLEAATEWQPWMSELEKDNRKSVQSLLVQWHRRKNLRKALLDAHNEKSAFDGSFKSAAADWIAGVDEAGRGPLAGPVVTAAVILPADCELLIGLNDSKQLSREKREQYAAVVKKLAVSYAVHVQQAEEIDRLNIYEATKQSMTAAVKLLTRSPAAVLADAMQLPVEVPCHSIIKGDAKSLAIAAASVLAKTERDRIMTEYAAAFPEYGFERHAGYGTKEHLEALARYGVTPIHRKTFEPVKSMVTGVEDDGIFGQFGT